MTRTIVKETGTEVISDNIQVKITEDNDRVYIEVLENKDWGDSSNNKIELAITNNLSIPKARELDLKL